jgi:hypothetical protein
MRRSVTSMVGFRGEISHGGGGALGGGSKNGSWRDSESLGEFGS